MKKEKWRRIMVRYYLGYPTPANPVLQNPNYFCARADAWQKAARNALGLGPAQRFTSKAPADSWHHERILASCVALKMTSESKAIREFAGRVVDRPGTLPRTKGEVYEYLAGTLARAWFESRRESLRKDSRFGPFFDWERVAYLLHEDSGLFTPKRCMLIALRAWHIYRFRRWRRLAQTHKHDYIPLVPWPDEPDKWPLSRKRRAQTMRVYLRATKEGRFAGHWPWNIGVNQNVHPLIHRRLPDWKTPRP